tara:strand:- start:866 stop:1120 length:255 start_codon:yes stop_codon:yes gene_type:complete
MKVKNLLDDIKTKSLNELTDLAINLTEKLEREKNLEIVINEYQNLIKLNQIIEKKFKATSKEISSNTRDKINKILKKKYEKKIK